MEDIRQDTVEIVEDVGVPVADDAIAVILDHLGSRRICLPGAIMLATIDLDDQFRPAAGEIRDGATNWKLLGVVTIELTTPQSRPE